jgi:Rod binding domain-containing protein
MAAVDPALLAGCQQFEAVLLRPLFDQLHLGRLAPLAAHDTREPDDPSGATDLMSSLFADALSLAMVRAGGLGLASELARALSGKLP